MKLAKLAFRESGESAQHGLANVGEFGESTQHGSANVGESGESARHGLANVSESGESDTFPKKAILASTRIRQKWQIFGEYSNLTNSLSSGHCLVYVSITYCLKEKLSLSASIPVLLHSQSL